MATHIQGGISILGAMALCCAVSLFSAENKKDSTIPPAQPKASASTTKETNEIKDLETAEKDIADIDSDVQKEAAKTLAKLASDKKIPWISYTARALLADYYIEENDLKKAADVLKDCNDYTKIGASKDTDHGTAYLKCFLEYAKLEAAKKNIAEALKMANYAEGKTENLDKILVYCKYGEILGTPEVNQPDNAKKYFEKALKIANEKLKKLGDASVGEAKEDVSKEKREWLNLKKQIAEQQEKLQALLIAKEYGGDYSTYYLMMSAFYAKNYIKAQFYANKLIQQNDKSIYGEAARYYHAVCTMNIPENKKSSKIDAGVKEAEAELKKFIREKPYGDYRGDALMSLGAMELEHNFNMKAAGKYYEQALAYFKHQREMKNATDLFVIPDKVKEVSKPQGKTTYLDGWMRTVYREPSPMEIITARSAPWVIDEKEKECIFMQGFFLFMDGKFAEAKKCWEQTKNLDKDLSMLVSRKFPNSIARLSSACDQKFILFKSEEKKGLDQRQNTELSLAEFTYVLEKFDEAQEHFDSILKSPKSSPKSKTLALIGLGKCVDMTVPAVDPAERKKYADKYFKQAVNTAQDESVRAKALFCLACYYHASTDTRPMSIKYYEEYMEKYPKGENITEVIYRLAFTYISMGKMKEVAKYESKLATSQDERKSTYLKLLAKWKEFYSKDKEKKERNEK